MSEATKTWRPDFWIPSPIIRVFLDDGTSYDVQATSQDMRWGEANAAKGYGIDREKTPHKYMELLAWHIICHRLKYVVMTWPEYEHAILWTDSKTDEDGPSKPGDDDRADPTDPEPTTDS